jgi:hypothetical protein
MSFQIYSDNNNDGIIECNPSKNIKIMKGTMIAEHGIQCGMNQDKTSHIGMTSIGFTPGHSGKATFSHFDHNTETNCAIIQNANGKTQINSADGQDVVFSVNNVEVMKVTRTGVNIISRQFSINGSYGSNNDILTTDGTNISWKTPTTGTVEGVTAGTGLTGGGTSGSVTLNVSGLTVSELDASAVQISSESFVDNDTTLMTSAAIQDKILSYGYITSAGDIDGVTAGTGLTGGGTSGSVTLNVSGLTVSELDASAVQISSESFVDNDTTLMTSAAIQDKILSYGYTTNVGDVTGVVAGTNLNGGGTSGSFTINVDSSPEFSIVTVSNEVRISDGSSTDPSITFTSDGDTGIYRPATNELAITVGGVIYSFKNNGLHLSSGDWLRTYSTAGLYFETYGGGWYMTDTSWIKAYNSKHIYTPGVIRGDSSLQTNYGSDTYPTHTFHADKDTGMYRVSSNVLGLACGGRLILRVGSSYIKWFAVLPVVGGYRTLRRRSSDNVVGYEGSSRRYKENILDIDKSLWSKIYNLRPVTFDWLESVHGTPDNRNDEGLIAEEVYAEIPELVYMEVVEGRGSTPIPDGVQYEKLSVYLLAALKDMNTRVLALEARI